MHALFMSAALVVATSAAQAADAPAGVPAERQVVTLDRGPGRSMTIVRDGRSSEVSDGEHEALTYIDGRGARVHVYADHPVTRAEIEGELRDAERERLQGLREAGEGRRQAAMARIEAQAARQEAAQARIEGMRAAEDGRREAQRARREAERAIAEARRARAEARAEVADSAEEF
jgi:hypothetical protein